MHRTASRLHLLRGPAAIGATLACTLLAVAVTLGAETVPAGHKRYCPPGYAPLRLCPPAPAAPPAVDQHSPAREPEAAKTPAETPPPAPEAPAEPFAPPSVGYLGTPDNFSPNMFGDAGPMPMFITIQQIRTGNFNNPDPKIVVGGAGRTKLSEGNNPLPRDRVIFDYDNFQHTRLADGGLNVQRFSPGLEKTFFDRRASIEVRLPFAQTLSSSLFTDDLSSTDTQFGDLHLTLKGLVVRNEVFNVATGLGLSLPTASDTRVRFDDGTDIARIQNEAVIVTPYVAALFTPNDRFFAQTWLACDIDSRGNPVQLNPGFFGGTLMPAGTLNDPALMQFDTQIGYWLWRNENHAALVRGLAPFMELHYATTLQNADSVRLNQLVYSNGSNRINEFNITAGTTAQLGDNCTLGLGVVAPLRSGDDRFFNWQVGLRLNYFFGPTARAREARSGFSGF